MKKIDLKKPKFILPLLLLPFLFFFFFVFFYEKDEPKESLLGPNDEGLNSVLPKAADNLEMQDRLQAYQEELRKERKNTGMRGIDREDNPIGLEEDSTGIRDSILLSLRNTIKNRKSDETGNERRQALKKAQENRKKLMELHSRTKQRNDNNSSLSGGAKLAQGNPGTTGASSEMDAFKAQMRYIDSMQNPEKYKAKELPTLAETEPKVYNVTRNDPNASRPSAYFNTIKADLGQTMITAILDEGIKAWEGSRVRIRLLEPIFIDGRLLEKGQYLYGICTSFQVQRLLIKVESVVIDGEIFPLDLSLYDNDGLEGIYIPDSSFRVFSKELGVSATPRNVYNGRSPDNNTQALYQSITQAVQSSSQAMRKALRKNKAKLKYNTQVYLVNNNTKN